jgi:cytochrome c5
MILSLVGCSEKAENSEQGIEMPRFSGEALSIGRSHWMGTCRNCHLLGTSGAPSVTDHAAWAPRISKGKAALYESALNGIRGPNEEIRMPPMGGNPRLSDEHVRLAVDYMVSSVKYLNEEALN